MTFLEIATAIDQAEKEVETAKAEVKVQENFIEALKTKHEIELTTAQEILKQADREANTLISRLTELVAQLHAKMTGTVPTPKPEPTSSELKDLYQAATKYRGKLG